LVRMPAFGLSGPYKNYRAFGTHVEGMIGHHLLRSYPDGSPDETGDAFTADAAGGTVAGTDLTVLEELVADVCLELATQMVGDAEGHTKVVRVEVTGAASPEAAAQAARKVAESQLVKCSWYGEDPYWGRVASDLGTSGVALDPAALTIAYGGEVVSRACEDVPHDEEAVRRHMAGEYLVLTCDLGVGSGADWVLSNDLTHAYIDENMGTS
jgi:glutamate N-acetyltransferase / amino-acid N-acetyltransferase